MVIELLELGEVLGEGEVAEVRRCATAGALPCHALYGVMPLSALVGARFRRWTAVTTASSQNHAGSLRCFSRARAMATTV
jgi:hypothetical protein